VIAWLWLGIAMGAEPIDGFVQRFLDALEAGDVATAQQSCSSRFRKRSKLGCDDLVEELVRRGSVARGRLAKKRREALVELWIPDRSGRTPIVLQAIRSEGNWVFVDGVDVDSGTLRTRLSLEGRPDPGAPTLPAGLDHWFERVGKGEARCSAESRAVCTDLLSKIDRNKLEFRPVAIRLDGDRSVVSCLVGIDGRPVDEVWMRFSSGPEGWTLEEIGEE